MDASRLVAAFALAQGQGSGKSGGRPVAAGLGAGLLKHTHPLMPPPLRSVGLGDTSTGRICHLVAKFSFNLHFTPRVSVSAHKHDEKMQELLQRQAYQCLKVLCIVAGLWHTVPGHFPPRACPCGSQVHLDPARACQVELHQAISKHGVQQIMAAAACLDAAPSC